MRQKPQYAGWNEKKKKKKKDCEKVFIRVVRNLGGKNLGE